jgi:hypothetical protein
MRSVTLPLSGADSGYWNFHAWRWAVEHDSIAIRVGHSAVRIA